MEGVEGSLGRVETGGDECCRGDKSSGYETLCNVPQRPMMVLVSAQGEEDGWDLQPQALSTATCTSHSGANLLGKNSGTLTMASSKAWLPICLSCWYRAFLLPLHDTLPDASEKIPV